MASGVGDTAAGASSAAAEGGGATPEVRRRAARARAAMPVLWLEAATSRLASSDARLAVPGVRRVIDAWHALLALVLVRVRLGHLL